MKNALLLADAETIARHQPRYDVKIILPLKMGPQFVKRTGTTTRAPTRKLRYTYPELYEVLDGDAHYLLRRAQTISRESLMTRRNISAPS